jgi:hypothetical protein
MIYGETVPFGELVAQLREFNAVIATHGW